MSINLNNTTPAAPSSTVNVSWQKDSSGNVSANVPLGTSLIDPIDVTGQTANISSTNIVATPVNGAIYRISVYEIVTTSAVSSSTLPSVVIGWTDADNATPQTATLTPASPTGNSLTTYVEGDVVIHASSAAPITYSTTGYASNPSTTMQYALHIRTELTT
jgi:hypothetical protein